MPNELAKRRLSFSESLTSILANEGLVKLSCRCISTMTMSDDPNLQSSPPGFVHTSASLCYAVTHVFFPVRPPEKSDYTPQDDRSLARAVCAAADVYGARVYGTSEQAQWNCVARMLHNLLQSEHLDNDHVSSQLRGMRTGGVFTVFL